MIATRRPFALTNGRWLPAPRVADDSSELRVLTWNAWFGDYLFADRTAAIRAELASRRPHVIALQEVTAELLDELLAEPWLRRDYQVSDTELWQRYDVVALARVPIRAVTTVELPTLMGRRLVVLELACGLAVGSVHLESMKTSTDLRVAQLELIQRHLAVHPDAALVGDLNFSPTDPRETAALGPDVIDAWPALHPDDPGYTADGQANLMRNMLKPDGAQKRIDRVLVRSPAWRATAIELVGTRAIDTDGTFASDHFGLEATISR